MPLKNRLAQEKSPYLLQHADNPVDWYPWGDEALSEAKKQDKPIFLSIGYSTCHWCHVMAHESFENPDIAKLMNERFINIKVDREERPDLDALYMLSVQMISGTGGWPMSVWLTPDLKPFYGGTYFPPDDRYGRPGFPTVITQLAQLWKSERTKIVESSDELTQLISKASRIQSSADQLPLDIAKIRTHALQQLENSFDSEHGGFGRAPKFPMPVNLQLLLHEHQCYGNKQALEMVRFTLQKMSAGGLYDQLGGGFARYSTDEKWLVPHFEKMLYDNAQLLSVYAEYRRQTGDEQFDSIIRGTADYVLRDLTHPDGGFYSAEDADSEGKEGTFYLWTLKELTDLLKPEQLELAIRCFGVTLHGNFKDPHADDLGKNILSQVMSTHDLAEQLHRAQDQIVSELDEIKKILFQARAKRSRPHLDDKILTGWNGLMISALSEAGAELNDLRYLLAAKKAATFIKTHLFDSGQQALFRRWREGERRFSGQQPDYALLIQGLLDLFTATGEAEWLSWARDLQTKHDHLFLDEKGGGYFMTEPQQDLLIRIKDESDNVIPSGNSVALWNMLRFLRLFGDKTFDQSIRNITSAFAKLCTSHPNGFSYLIAAIDTYHRGSKEIVIVSSTTDRTKNELLRVAQTRRERGWILIPVEDALKQKELANILPWIASMKLQQTTTAFVCDHFSCQEPTADSQHLIEQLQR